MNVAPFSVLPLSGWPAAGDAPAALSVTRLFAAARTRGVDAALTTARPAAIAVDPARTSARSAAVDPALTTSRDR